MRQTEMLFDEVVPTLKNFPRSERATLVNQIKLTLWEIMGKLLSAPHQSNLRDFTSTIKEVRGKCYFLAALFQTAKRYEYISIEFHTLLSRRLSDISNGIHAIIDR